ncbi:MAG TPA: hypothetical protein VK518_22805, partial [Puia sp.]|nr:hypothetical protein [Puia sp.]
MQSNSHNEHELVKICLSELCTRAGLPGPGDLVQRDMIALCDTIESNTGVIISLSTIKRLLNGQFARIPQVATLNAIALSAGYKDWRDFTQVKAPLERALKQSPGSPGPWPKPRSRPRFLLAGAALLLVFLATLAIVMSHKPGSANIDKAHFSATKVT